MTLQELRTPGTLLPTKMFDKETKYSVNKSDEEIDDWYTLDNKIQIDRMQITYGSTNRHSEECIWVERLNYDEDEEYYEIPVSEFIRLGIINSIEEEISYNIKYTEEYCTDNRIIVFCGCKADIEECDKAVDMQLHKKLYNKTAKAIKPTDNFCIMLYTTGYAKRDFYTKNGFKVITAAQFVNSFKL